MAWTAVTPSTATWAAATAAAKSWSEATVATVPPAWSPLRSVTTTVDQGVDFRLVLSEEFPWHLSADRPAILKALHETP